MWNTVFASSLLSLISPWAGSRGAGGRTAKAPRTPAPPPPPRRHSDPATAQALSAQRTPRTTHRRFSDTRHTGPGLDLRQELLQLNLSNRDVDKWLGKFDEKEEDYEVDFRFAHDIPLQRTISLDRGIDIFNYLQTLSSDSGSDLAVSVWTIGSDNGSGLRAEQQRSFDDIPASPVKAKSRHVSVDVTNTMLGNSLAFSVLRESYKGLDAESGRVTPQIRKLQKTFSFKSFDEYKESADSSTENLATVDTEVDIGGIEMRQPAHVCRSISFESENEHKSPRQRRIGVTSNAWQVLSSKYENINFLPKPSLIHFKSCDDVFIQDKEKYSRLGSIEAIDRVSKVTFLEDKKGQYQSDALRNIRKLRKNLLMRSKSECRELVVPAIIVTEVDSCNEIDVANIEKDIIQTDSSNLVEIGRNCDCSICSGTEGEQKVSFLSRSLNRIFVRLASYKEYGRKLAFWDENNNFNENEMFSCFIHIMKLLLGLWLRHLDHKQHNLCA